MAIKSLTPIDKDIDKILLTTYDCAIMVDKTNLKIALCFYDIAGIELLQLRRRDNFGYTIYDLNKIKIPKKDLEILQKIYGDR